MKKKLLLMLGAIVALTSCQKDAPLSAGNGQEVAITIAASLPNAITSKAATTNLGGIDNVDWNEVSLRYTLEIYDGETLVPIQKGSADAQRYQYKTESTGAKNVSFENIRLLSGKKYQFVIWADFVKKDDKSSLHYDISNGLKSITQIASTLVGNDDSRDAYFATQEISVSAPVTQSVTLKRPFGKLRVITTDIKDIHVAIDGNTTTTVTYRTAVPTGFNAYNGEVSTTTAVPATYTAKIEELTATTATLAFDYIFAAATTAEVPVQTAINFKIACLTAEYDFASSSVKIERNKLTTVKGNLLTKGVTLSVTIDDMFENEIVNEILDVVPTISAVQEKLNKAADENGQAVAVRVTEPVTATQTLTIPEDVKIENTPKIDLNLSAGIAAGQTLTIAEESPAAPETHFTGEVYITVPESDAAHLVVNMPSSTVYINGKLSSLNATVSPNTLVIAKGVEIGTLTIHAGNVEILGKVGVLNKANDYVGKIFWGAATYDELKAVLAKKTDNDGVILTDDITGTINDQALISINKEGYLFDGRGHSVTGSATQNIITVDKKDVTVKNVTITNTLKNGMTVYRTTGAVLENVTFLNNNKLGLVVNGSTVTASNITAIGTKGTGSINLGKGSGVTERPILNLNGTNNIQKGLMYQIYADFADADKSDCLVAQGWSLVGAPTDIYVSWSDNLVLPFLGKTWATDRTEPKAFTVSGGKITMTTNVTPTTGFYSWCGKAATIYNSPNNNWSLEAIYTRDEVMVNKEVGLWAVVRPDGTNELNYPIIAYYREGDVEGWKYWRSFAESDNWVKLPNVPVLNGDNKMRISYEAGIMKYYINDALVATDNTYTAKTGTLTSVIINQKNAEQEYTSEITVPVVKSIKQ